MDIYKQAAFTGLRIPTSQGLLSVEQLTTLSLTALAAIVKNAKKALNKDNDDDLSFLDETKTVNKEQSLIFEIAKDIYLTKKEEREETRRKAENKAKNEKIKELLYKKQNEKLENLSAEELEAMLLPE